VAGTKAEGRAPASARAPGPAALFPGHPTKRLPHLPSLPTLTRRASEGPRPRSLSPVASTIESASTSSAQLSYACATTPSAVPETPPGALLRLKLEALGVFCRYGGKVGVTRLVGIGPLDYDPTRWPGPSLAGSSPGRCAIANALGPASSFQGRKGDERGCHGRRTRRAGSRPRGR
jgi:hypothetical protein